MNGKEQDVELRDGKNEIMLDSSAFESGKNTLKISTYGHYTLDNVELRALKAEAA